LAINVVLLRNEKKQVGVKKKGIKLLAIPRA
jgi:hypothetical protein